MKKTIIILLFLMVLPAVNGLTLQELKDFDHDNELKSFKVEDSLDFQLEVNQRDKISVFNQTSKIGEFNPHGRTAFALDSEIINGSTLWLTGSKFYDPKWFIHSNGTKTSERSIHTAVDTAKLFKNKLIVGDSSHYSLYTIEGEQIWSNPSGNYLTTIADSGNLYRNNRTEVILRNNGRGPLRVISLQTGEIKIKIDSRGSFTDGKIIGNKLLVWSHSSLDLLNSTGTEIWTSNRKPTTEPIPLDNSLVYSSGDKIVKIDYNESLKKEKQVKVNLRKLSKIPSRDLLVGYQNDNVSVFSLQGEKLGSTRVDGLSKGPEFGDYDQDGAEEVVVSADGSIKVLDLNFENSWNKSLSETVFVGKGREMLEAVALNSTAYISESGQSFEEDVLGVNIPAENTTRDVNSEFGRENCTKLGDREKAVYAAALAARNGSCIDLSENASYNRSIEELKERFIQVFRPNHVVVADLDSESGVLAAEMAVKQGAYPVDFDREFSYENFNSTWNRYNGVIKLENKIEKAFEKIGENRNTVFEGKQISLLNAPRKLHEDPVEKGFFDDPEDGEKFFSDLSYGNLDNDSFLEAGVGRYPSDTSKASKLFNRSMEREIGSEAVLGSEYLHEEWPVVLTTFGGGLRHGTTVELVLKEEGYNVTHFVERRSDPLQVLYSLTPVKIGDFMKNADRADSFLKKAGSNAGSLAKNSLTFIRSLKFAEDVLKMMFEFRWESFEFNVERGMERMEDWEIPKGKTPTEVLQKGVVQILYNFLWPEPHPELEKDAFLDETKGSDIVYYQGIGSQDSWKLPQNNNYNITISPSDIPELEKPIVWDSSFKSGTRNAKMRNEFVKKGASAHLGFSTVNYAAFSSILDAKFFKNGKTLGSSLKKSVNSLRHAGLVYNPTSFHRNGVRSKMEKSLSLMGNPEMPKDPIDSGFFNTSRQCERTSCTLRAELEPEIRFSNNSVDYNSSSRLVEPGAPITPLYSFSRELPGKIESVEVENSYSDPQNIELPTADLLSHSGSYKNISRNQESFPSKEFNYSTGEKLHLTHSGLKKIGEKVRILENASIEIKYRTPVTVSLKEGDNIQTEVYSNRSRNLTLAYRIDNSTGSREVKLDKGKNRFEIQDLDTGIHQVEVVALDDNVLSRDSRTYQVAENLSYSVKAGLEEGARKNLKIEAHNPNSFKVSKPFNLSLGKNLVLAPLEDGVKRIDIAPNQNKSLKFEVVALESSESSIEIGNKVFQLKPEGSPGEKVSRGVQGIERSLGSKNLNLFFRSKSSGSQTRISAPKISISSRKSSNRKVSKLETSEFSVKKIVSGEVRHSVSKDGRSFILRKDGSFKSRSSGMNRTEALKLIDIAEEEFDKLEKFRQVSLEYGR